MLTQAPPFRNFIDPSPYCNRREFLRKTILSRNIGQKGIECVENMLAILPERRIAAEEALNSERLRLEDEGAVGSETEKGSAGRVLPKGLALPGATGVIGQSPPGIWKAPEIPSRLSAGDLSDRDTFSGVKALTPHIWLRASRKRGWIWSGIGILRKIKPAVITSEVKEMLEGAPRGPAKNR
jgi:hypothetical protein